MAILAGTISVVDGCMLITTDTGATYTPVFSDDVEWSENILTYNSRRYAIGDVIELGGGETGTSVDKSGYSFPANCPGPTMVWRVP